MAFSKLLTRMTRAHVYPTQITRWPLCNLSFAVDPVDPAIRHENGKQVARWNVDPAYEMATAASYPAPPPQLGHAPHPATISANRTQAFTIPSSRHHPNGKKFLTFDLI